MMNNLRQKHDDHQRCQEGSSFAILYQRIGSKCILSKPFEEGLCMILK